jgi:aspartyl-tRNA(Asn)/glutamyl-tRNA(Gln) amidotransferase subunit C
MNIEDLRETAALAHLNLDEAELAASFPAFEQMLGFFAAMQSADEDPAVFPASAPDQSGLRTVGSDFFRPDVYPSVEGRPVHNPNNAHTTASNGLNPPLINNAGERDGRFIVVPNVL